MSIVQDCRLHLLQHDQYILQWVDVLVLQLRGCLPSRALPIVVQTLASVDFYRYTAVFGKESIADNSMRKGDESRETRASETHADEQTRK